MQPNLSPEEQSNGKKFIYVVTVKFVKNTSENTEKDTLTCKEIKLQKYRIVPLLLHAHIKRYPFFTTNFSTHDFEKQSK